MFLSQFFFPDEKRYMDKYWKSAAMATKRPSLKDRMIEKIHSGTARYLQILYRIIPSSPHWNQGPWFKT